jgi:hypothetical protein
MELQLNGRIITPIITKKTVFKLEECNATIISPKRRYITKSHKERRIYPFSFIGYLGTIKLTYRCQTLAEAKRKLAELVRIAYIGRFWSEGLGRVEWLKGKISKRKKHHKKAYHVRTKIRKGLPHNLPVYIQQLLRYALLHDFVHTPRHKSKIYVEIQVGDIQELKKHHEQNQNELINTFQKYDRIAASMTRKIRSPRKNRYTWEAQNKVDFKNLKQELEKIESNIWRLYQYIYESKELKTLNESLNHGHSSLQYHLLLIANLIVQDYFRRKF